LTKAFHSGFTEIVHAKTDKDLISVQNSDEFKKLTQLNIEFSVNWNMLVRDKLTIKNQSSFNWTNVIIRVKFREDRSQDWYTGIGNQGLQIGSLDLGASVEFEAFNSTKIGLDVIQLKIQTDQGELTVTLKNNNGVLTVIPN
jgi:hypothetical protein